MTVPIPLTNALSAKIVAALHANDFEFVLLPEQLYTFAVPARNWSALKNVLRAVNGGKGAFSTLATVEHHRDVTAGDIASMLLDPVGEAITHALNPHAQKVDSVAVLIKPHKTMTLNAATFGEVKMLEKRSDFDPVALGFWEQKPVHWIVPAEAAVETYTEFMSEVKKVPGKVVDAAKEAGKKALEDLPELGEVRSTMWALAAVLGTGYLLLRKV